jgi:hypothetical protein
MQNKRLQLPPSYILDMSDSDVLVLRRSDGSSVAAFSARGADPMELRRVAEEDRLILAATNERLPNVLRKARTAARLRPSPRGTLHRRH